VLQTVGKGPLGVITQSPYKSVSRSRSPNIEFLSQFGDEFIDCWQVRFFVESFDARPEGSVQDHSQIFVLKNLEFVQMRFRCVCKDRASIGENWTDIRPIQCQFWLQGKTAVLLIKLKAAVNFW
jgi:hypothetical protein